MRRVRARLQALHAELLREVSRKREPEKGKARPRADFARDQAPTGKTPFPPLTHDPAGFGVVPLLCGAVLAVAAEAIVAGGTTPVIFAFCFVPALTNAESP